MRKYVNVDIDVDIALDEFSDDELQKELEGRGFIVTKDAVGQAGDDSITQLYMAARFGDQSSLRRTRALAEQEEMAAAKMRGDLVARDDVDAAMRFVGATLRSLLEVMPDQVAPLVTPVAQLDEVNGVIV